MRFRGFTFLPPIGDSAFEGFVCYPDDAVFEVGEEVHWRVFGDVHERPMTEREREIQKTSRDEGHREGAWLLDTTVTGDTP